jgi:CubicO group peptidase (beta-lactamase class C family)
LQRPTTIEDLYDISTANERLAAGTLWWLPGTVTGYHPITQGHIISELALRVTGKRVREFIAEGLAGPLKADFQLGVLPKDRSRVAEIISPPLDISTDFDIDSLAGRALTTPAIRAELAETPALWDAERWLQAMALELPKA